MQVYKEYENINVGKGLMRMTAEFAFHTLYVHTLLEFHTHTFQNIILELTNIQEHRIKAQYERICRLKNSE